MTPNLFRAIGEALYGPQWQSEMARQLDVALRTVQRWSVGTSPVPDSVRPELVSLLRENSRHTFDLAERVCMACANMRVKSL